MSATAMLPAPETRDPLLEGGALARRGGFAILSLLDVTGVRALYDEALACHAWASATQVERSDGAERGGSPDRWFETAVGGDALNGLYRSDGLADTLLALTGARWLPSGEGGTYTYYRSRGHHLGLHRDVDTCDLAVIVCVADQRPDAGAQAGDLVVYPARSGESLAAIRAEPACGAVRIRSQPGEAVILLGGLVPHRLEPVAAGQLRIVAPLCFTPA